MHLLKWLIVAALVYGGFVVLMYVAQRSLMYFPERLRTAPVEAGLPGVQEVVLDTADGEKVIVWHAPPQGDRPLVIYFHGNGGALRLRANRFRALLDHGFGLVALSYRGYGGSTGSPSEAGLIADAEAAYAFAAARTPAARIALFGESLGSGVAVALAARHPVGRVVLEAPFTSAADVAARVKAPLLIMHGTRDGVVPFAFGERLFALANEPKRFVRFTDGGHSDLDRFGAIEAVRTFLDGPAP